MSRQDTKQHILDTGQALILKKGYGNTGLNEILEQAAVPKGSFYYYFNSKEDFGLQMIDVYEQMNRGRFLSVLQDTERTPLQRLRQFFERNIAYLSGFNFTQGCLLGDLAQEMSGQNDNFQARVNQALSTWTQDIALCLREAQVAGELSPDADVEALADFCLNGWQGALLRMKAVKNSAPLENFINVIFNTLLRG